uniref:ParB/Sulfiredoxin domain-containing protein n=1 Tax=viral metagenome TaxID=1070528 RepID=A0A6C0CA41_9ZZZZ
MCSRKELGSLGDALVTFNTHFCKPNHRLREFQNYKKVRFDMKMSNQLHNLLPTKPGASNSEKAYPLKDSTDISSVYNHMHILKTNPGSVDEPLPVIAVIRNGDHETYFLLDGAHRFVAANLMKLTYLSVIFVYLPIDVIRFR